jgi:hypothetical protein
MHVTTDFSWSLHSEISRHPVFIARIVEEILKITFPPNRENLSTKVEVKENNFILE